VQRPFGLCCRPRLLRSSNVCIRLCFGGSLVVQLHLSSTLSIVKGGIPLSRSRLCCCHRACTSPAAPLTPVTDQEAVSFMFHQHQETVSFMFHQHREAVSFMFHQEAVSFMFHQQQEAVSFMFHQEAVSFMFR